MRNESKDNDVHFGRGKLIVEFNAVREGDGKSACDMGHLGAGDPMSTSTKCSWKSL
jgi:hypothetical protein